MNHPRLFSLIVPERLVLFIGFLFGAGSAFAQTITVTLTPTEYNGYNISCFGLNDGSLDASVSGGTAPYTYAWTTAEATEDISGLVAGYYKLLVTDANGLTGEAEITLTEPLAISLSMDPFEYPSGMNISCHECYNGSINVEVAHGVPPYSYDWGDDVTTQDRSNLGAMRYHVLVTDANGCEAEEGLALQQPERDDWNKSGSANTDPTIQFIGTTDARDMVFKSNGQEMLRLKSNGDFSLLGSLEEGLLYRGGDGTLSAIRPLPPPEPGGCVHSILPYWSTSGNYLNACQMTRVVLGTLDHYGVDMVTSDDVRMKLWATGHLQIGNDLETWPIGEPQSRVAIQQGHGNWLTLNSRGANPNAPAGFWALHNPEDQNRLIWSYQPASGASVGDVLTLWNDGKVGIGSNAVSSEGMRLNVTGGAHFDKVVIGSVDAPEGYQLYVADGVLSEKVKVAVRTSAEWSDYVFSSNYTLMPLADVELFIEKNGHLPGIPSAECMVEQGLDVAKTDAMLLAKIEELTLYIIALEEKVQRLQDSIRTTHPDNN